MLLSRVTLQTFRGVYYRMYNISLYVDLVLRTVMYI